jgi:thiol-disulfide isomerase/thioredoxin
MVARVLRSLAAALLLMIALIGATAASANCSDVPPALGRFEAGSGKEAPAAPFLAGGETERTFADFAGQALVVNLWATWCAPCVTEMPALDRLSGEVAGDGIAVLTLSADREGAPVIEAFFAANGIRHLPVMVDRMGKVARALGVPGLPTTILYDRQGRELGRVVGTAEWDAPEAVAFLRACLASAA